MANVVDTNLELARAAQRRGSYTAADERDLVEVEVDGTYAVKKVKIDAAELGIDPAVAEKLAAALSEASAAAVEKARRRAKGRLEKVLASRESGS